MFKKIIRKTRTGKGRNVENWKRILLFLCFPTNNDLLFGKAGKGDERNSLNCWYIWTSEKKNQERTLSQRNIREKLTIPSLEVRHLQSDRRKLRAWWLTWGPKHWPLWSERSCLQSWSLLKPLIQELCLFIPKWGPDRSSALSSLGNVVAGLNTGLPISHLSVWGVQCWPVNSVELVPFCLQLNLQCQAYGKDSRNICQMNASCSPFSMDMCMWRFTWHSSNLMLLMEPGPSFIPWAEVWTHHLIQDDLDVQGWTMWPAALSWIW